MAVETALAAVTPLTSDASTPPDPDEVLKVLRMRERVILAGLERLRGQIVVARDNVLNKRRREGLTVPMKMTAKRKNKTVCSVCLTGMGRKNVIDTKCKHKFHIGCLDHWLAVRCEGELEQSCPVCRTDLL